MSAVVQSQGLLAITLHCLDTRAVWQRSLWGSSENILSNISSGRQSTGSRDGVTVMLRLSSEWVSVREADT